MTEIKISYRRKGELAAETDFHYAMRSLGYQVSKVLNSTSTFPREIHEWCRDNGIDYRVRFELISWDWAKAVMKFDDDRSAVAFSLRWL